mmetsp:Transcript_28264/g.40380  ORF Transcript_28264/g.40380 Transcript_28264/m.40380 type:complete len:962 (+) Transcript_28264:70-2955(+)
MMKRFSSLFKLMMPLLVACLLLATKGTDAQESNDRRRGLIIDSAQPLLGKSDHRISRRLYKSNENTSRHTYWQAGHAYNGKATKKDSKSSKSKSSKSKSSKSKAEKMPVYPWMGVRPGPTPTKRPTERPTPRPASRPKPTRKPTKKPSSSITPPTLPPLPDKFVEISMGGVLAATNLVPIPPSGSDQMKELARIFEDTILSSLDDTYKCIVYEIGGTPVRIGGVRSVSSNRRLQGESQVRFTLRVTKPCSGCDKADAMILGSLVFDQTFETLNESAESGDMTTSFCSNAEGTGLVSSPCQVTITSVEGASLDVKFVEDTTPKPTMPPVKWDPTPAPTLKPVTTAPTRKGDTASPTDETYAPSTPAPSPTTVKPSTSSPVMTPSTSSPTMTPSTSSPVAVPTTIAPTSQPTSTPTLNPSSPKDTLAPTRLSIPTSIAPTSTPPGAIYYTGFETGEFPNDSYWTTSEATPWIINTEKVQSGVFSIRSANLESEELTPRDSNVTFTTGDNFPSGMFVINILSGTRMPFDDLQYFVDGVFRGRIQGETDFEVFNIPVGPGKHEILFIYKYNPIDLPQFPPKGDFDHLGAVYLDNVYFLPDGNTMSPTREKTSVQPTVNSNPQTVAPTPQSGAVTPVPSATDVTIAPTATGGAPTPSFFDGFESGDFSAESWSIAGEDAWVVDQTRPYEGSYSAHVKTADIPESQLYSELNLEVSLGAAGFIQFFFFAPISQPFEAFELWVDGQFLTPLTTEGGEWAQAGSILSSGDHTVAWRYSKNPAGAPDAVLDTWPQPDFRLGEAWLDNVKLLGSTPSFTEIWDSGDFSANPWILSGDGNWSITDSEKVEGEYSATIAAADIEASSGTADLSIDLITEKGGTLTGERLLSLQSTFDLFQILIDDIKVFEYSEIQDVWMSLDDVTIQPGKRQVTFRLVKNPNNFDEAVLSTIPEEPNYQGQVWLDKIVFTANS